MRANVRRGDNYNKLITRTTLKTRVEICIQWYFAFVGYSRPIQLKTDLINDELDSNGIGRTIDAYDPMDAADYLRVIRFKQHNLSFISVQLSLKLGVGAIVRNHLNIKSLGNYSGIHPSLITPEGGMREKL